MVDLGTLISLLIDLGLGVTARTVFAVDQTFFANTRYLIVTIRPAASLTGKQPGSVGTELQTEARPDEGDGWNKKEGICCARKKYPIRKE